MAVANTFNSIVSEIQMSKLNFTIQLTPFTAYITLKKSTQVDKNGVPSEPAPPIFLLLQQTHEDLLMAQEELSTLRVALSEKNQTLDDLVSINASLHSKL